MSKQLSVGNKVLCRFFNTPDKRFYGDYLVATIIEIDTDHQFSYYWGPKKEVGYLVKFDEDRPNLWLHRKEIKRRIES